ncbi:hypothetical protein, partial [Methylobacterium sp. WL12]|uniref:hypothetical protein n=1 Tax=Methylobacterium sp. WL12 TaxID=2603890 RepID=UPI001AEDDE9F
YISNVFSIRILLRLLGQSIADQSIPDLVRCAYRKAASDKFRRQATRRSAEPRTELSHAV